MTKEFLVLTAPPGAGVLTADLVSRIADILAGATSPNVLGDAEAVEFGLSETNETSEQDMENAVRQCLGSAPVDINIVAAAERHKQLLVADMESTIIEQECLDELAVEFGVQEKMVDITARAMRGELDFEPSLRERVAMLTGLPVSALQTLYDNRISLMPGAATLLATLNANATTCGLVSGAFGFSQKKLPTGWALTAFRAMIWALPIISWTAPSQTQYWVAQPKPTLCGTGAKSLAFHRLKFWPWAMARMIWQCWRPPVWGLRFGPNPPWPLPHATRWSMAT